MGRLIERLDGGLVHDRDPALLKPGQFSFIRNLVYKNGAAGLFRAKGRAVFGVVSATATGIPGLRDVHFDNGDHYLIAMAGTKYRAAPVGDTGTFADLATIAAGTSLEVVHYRNRFFLMNGASADASAIGTNVVVYQSATAVGTGLLTRQHGMLPVIAAPNVATAAGAFSQTVTGYYEYWTTEVAKLTQDGAQVTLESAFSSDNGISTVFVSATGVEPIIQQPTIKNSLTTHWRIYRSTKKDKLTDKKFPTGFMIAELATAASAHADTTAVASASSFPGSFNGSGFYFDFASASSMASDNGVYASATVGSTPTTVQQGAYNFTLGSFSGSVQGIKVEVEAYVSSGSAPVPVEVSIGKRRSSDGHFLQVNKAKIGQRPSFVDVKATKSGLVTSTNSAAPTLLTLGGSTDRWFPTNEPGLVDTDFDTSLMVVVAASKASTSIGVDFVRVTAYYGASVDSTVVFSTVVYTFGDITSQVAKDFPPPSANTGDLYQDSLVTNDTLNPSVMRWSFPGEPESFPPTYFLDFETRDNDIVRAIRVVNNHLVVGLDTSLWRVNYLPSERDATFDRGRAIEVISRSFGIVGPMLCASFTIDGESEQLAFVSHKGICTTDGFNFVNRSKNLDWRKIISLTSTSAPIALLNDPENRELLFYFRNDDSAQYSTNNYRCLHCSYDRGDIDAQGNFKYSGLVTMENTSGGQTGTVDSVWAVPRSNGSTGIYIGYGGSGASATAAGAGSVYFETGADLSQAGAFASCQVTTRRIFASGISGEWVLDDIYGYMGSYSGAPQIIYFVQGSKTNDTGDVAIGQTPALTLQGQKLHKFSPRLSSEGMTVRCSITTTADCEYDLMVLGSKSLGLEQAGT